MEEIEEVWRDIEGYEGLYQVSNLGRVKSSDSYDRLGRLHLKGRILKPGILKDGYLQVTLCKEGKKKMFKVHRLVAQTFIPNPEGLPQINHKDEDKANNRVLLKDDGSVDECRSNLEWCTAKYNSNYGTRNERVSKNMVQTKISKGIFDPELCGMTRKEHARLYYQKKREQILEQQREQYRRRRKIKPSGESLW